MSRKKPIFTTGEIYHVYNRGVEKRKIFMGKSDYLEMIHDLDEMNDIATLNFEPRRNRRANPSQTKRAIVEILAFVLMPNHYHLALRQIEENGIVTFMQKLGTGYAMYFNKKNKRIGPLFQGPFQATHIDTNDYLRNLIGYIHTNPVKIFFRRKTKRTNRYGTLKIISLEQFSRLYRRRTFRGNTISQFRS